MKVFVANNSTGDQTAVSVETGSTVGDAVRAAGISPDSGITVRKNRAESTLSDIVCDGDKISVTRKDLKGAAEEVDPLQVTYNDIVNAGKGPAAVASGVVAEAMAAHARSSREKLVAEVTSLLKECREESPCVNRAVADAQKALDNAIEDQGRFSYALTQLTENGNIFSMLGFLGRKDEATSICNRLGCAVPPACSPLWHTSANGK